MKLNLTNEKILKIILIIIFILSLGFVLGEKKLFNSNPFERSISLKRPSAAIFDQQGNTYIVDKSMMRIIKTDKNNKVLFQINGGINNERTFYRTRHIEIDNQGYIYCTNDILDKDGIELIGESILRFNSNGKLDKELSRYTYANLPEPQTNNLIKNIKIIDNSLYYTYIKNNSILVYKATDTKNILLKSYHEINASEDIINCELDSNLNIYYTTKQGQIIVNNGKDKKILFQGYGKNTDTTDDFIPYDLAIDANNNIYFTDIGSNEIKKIDHSQVTVLLKSSNNYGSIPSNFNPVFEGIYVSQDGQKIITTDKFAILTKDHNQYEKIQKVIKSPVITLQEFIFWLCFLIIMIYFVYSLLILIKYLKKHPLSKSNKNIIYIFLITFISSIIVATPLIVQYYNMLNQNVLNMISSITYAASKTLDGDKIEELTGLDNYNNKNYVNLKRQMNDFIRPSYDNNDNLYYAIYKTNNHDVYRIMDLEGESGIHYKTEELYENSIYEKCTKEQKIQLISGERDSEGIWTYGVAPIFNSSKKVVGFIEMGKNYYTLHNDQKELLIDIVLLVITSVVIMMFCFTEGMCFLEAIKKQLLLKNTLQNNFKPGIEIIRPLTFALLFATHLESAFLPIYIEQIYQPLFGLPKMVGIGIPLAAESLTICLCALIGGFLEEKINLKRLLLSGIFISIAGFIVSASIPNVIIFTLGKFIIGAGMGIIYVSLDILIAQQGNEEEVHKGFINYYSSYSSSINVACIVGGVLAMFINYRLTYYVGAVIMLLCTVLVCILMKGDWNSLKKENAIESNESEISIFNFLKNKKISSFFLFLYSPYLIASYFLHYFFPIFAHYSGITDGRVAQIFLIHGLIVTYLSNFTTQIINKILGNAGAAILGSLLYVGSLCLFIINPTIFYAIVVILIMGIADSFTFPSQTSYFNDLTIVKSYGIGKGNGIKNTMENISYSAAPFAFGGALLLGLSGIGIIAGTLAGFTGIFALCLLDKSRCKSYVNIKQSE